MMKKLPEIFRYLKNELQNPFTLSLILIFLTLVLLLPTSSFESDLMVYVDWINTIRNLGVANIYLQQVNYFPIFIYILYLFNLIIGSTVVLVTKIYLIKIFILIFDIGSIWLVGKLLKKLKLSAFLSLLILFNPAFFYNSIFWGQIEAIYIFFIVASLLAAIYHHPNWSIILFLLALYTKLQAIIFLPIIVLILLPYYWKNKKLIFQALMVIIISHVIILFPYIVKGPLIYMYAHVLKSFNMFPFLSANAFNFWVLIMGQSQALTTDATKFLFLSYKAWGIIMFAVSSVVIMLPLFWDIVRKNVITKIVTKEFVKTVFLVCGLISLTFFFFNTEMHERYLQPSIVLIGIALLLKPSKILILSYALISIAFFFNLEYVLQHFKFDLNNSLLFNPQLISLMYLVVLILGIWELYKSRNDFVKKSYKKKLSQSKDS